MLAGGSMCGGIALIGGGGDIAALGIKLSAHQRGGGLIVGARRSAAASA